MKLKILIYGFAILIFSLSCKDSVINADLSIPKIPQLKSAITGNNYYVAKTGKDSNTGTSASPFLTIKKAASVVKAGDTVIVRNGIYTTTEPYFLNVALVSGTALNPVIFKSEHKWGAKFDGQNNKTLNGFFISNSSYITIEDFEIYGCKDGGMKISTSSSNCTLRGNKIHDIAKMCSDDAYGHSGLFLSNCSNIIIEKNVLYNIGRFAPGENGCVPATPYWQNQDHGIYIASSVNGLTIYNNLIFACKAGWAVHAFNEGGYLNSNISILNNTFLDPNPNKIGHILLSTHLTNVLIANNIFYSPLTAAIYGVSDKVTYTNCIVKNNITYNSWISSGQTNGIAISNNLNNTNPLLVSPGTYDFRLQASSPAINAGIAVGLTSDYFGNSIIGLPDMGAIESTVSGPFPTTYYNTQVSASVTKNDCGTGYTGSTITYTVSAYKYSSTISQADSDEKATADLNANKQAYANANGSCTAISEFSIGLTTIGVLSEKGGAGYWSANSFTSDSNITVNKMNLYVGTASGEARLGIYSSISGQPGILLARTEEISLYNGWNSGKLGSSLNLISGVTYWLAAEVSSSATTMYYNSASGRHKYKSYPYVSLPSLAPNGCKTGKGIYSIYAD